MTKTKTDMELLNEKLDRIIALLETSNDRLAQPSTPQPSSPVRCWGGCGRVYNGICNDCGAAGNR